MTITSAPEVLYAALTMPRTDLGEWIYQLRCACDLTQAEFASRMRVGLSAVQKWEGGTRVPTGPAMELMRQMAARRRLPTPPDVSLRRGPRKD